MSEMGSIPEVQNYSLKVRKVLFSDVQGVDADRQSTTQYLQKFCLKVRKAPVIKTFSMRE